MTYYLNYLSPLQSYFCAFAPICVPFVLEMVVHPTPSHPFDGIVTDKTASDKLELDKLKPFNLEPDTI